MNTSLPQGQRTQPEPGSIQNPEPNRSSVRLRRLFPRSIRGTLILLLLVVLFPQLVSEGIHYHNLFQERRAEEYRTNMELARSVAATLDAYVRAILDQELAIGIALTSPQSVPDDQVARILTESARNISSIRHYLWLNPQGRVINSSPPLVNDLDLGSRAYFKQIAAGQEWVVSDLFQGQGRIADETIFVIVRGIRDANGVLQGVIVADVDPQRLGEVINLRRTGSAAFVVIDRQGRNVYRYPQVNLTWEQRYWLDIQPIISRALAGEEVSGNIFALVDNDTRMASYTPIRSIGWVASASRTENEAMAPIVQELLRESSQELLFSALALLVAIYLSQYIAVPIKRLQEHAAAIGRREFAHQSKVVGPTEITEVADVFNRMVGEIRSHEEQREKYIHDLRLSEAALRASEGRYRTLAEAAQDMIFVVNREGYIEYVNSYAAAQFGTQPDKIIGTRRSEWFPSELAASQQNNLQKIFQTGESAYMENWTLFKDRELWLGTSLVPINTENGEVSAVMGVSRDITERKMQEQQLAFLATHDPLTSLPNRRVLESAMERVVARARRGVVSILLFVDVDNFKLINDTLGHAAGDQALITLSHVLQNELRQEDLLVRLGGDEFAILLEGTGSEDAELVAERLCQAVRGFSPSADSDRYMLGLSVGMAIIDGQLDIQQTLAHADIAMYKAKEQGGNRITLYAPQV